MSNALHPKVAAAGASGAIATIVLFILQQAGVDASSEVGAAIATLVAFVAGFFKAA